MLRSSERNCPSSSTPSRSLSAARNKSRKARRKRSCPCSWKSSSTCARRRWERGGGACVRVCRRVCQQAVGSIEEEEQEAASSRRRRPPPSVGVFCCHGSAAAAAAAVAQMMKKAAARVRRRTFISNAYGIDMGTSPPPRCDAPTAALLPRGAPPPPPLADGVARGSYPAALARCRQRSFTMTMRLSASWWLYLVDNE